MDIVKLKKVSTGDGPSQGRSDSANGYVFIFLSGLTLL